MRTYTHSPGGLVGTWNWCTRGTQAIHERWSPEQSPEERRRFEEASTRTDEPHDCD